MSGYYPVTQRPLEFELEKDYPLWKDCVFAGLGRQTKSFTYRDSSLYGNHGTLTGYTGAGNTPPERWSRALGRATLSVGFGASSGYVPTVPGNKLVASNGDCSLSCWTYAPTALSTYSYVAGFCTVDSSGTNSFELFPDSTRMRLVAGDTAVAIVDPTAFPIAKWAHWVGVMKAGYISLYRNSVLVAGPTSCTLASPASRPFTIGCANGNYTEEPFPGSVADVLFHARALSPPEISLLAHPVRSIDYDGGLVWPRGRSQVWFGAAAPAGNRRRRFLVLGGS